MTTTETDLDMDRELLRLGACEEAQDWAKGKTLDVIWSTCERGDWLLWLAGRVGVKRQVLVLAACACARTALKYVKAGEERPRVAIETTEAWCRGEATIEQVRSARFAAYTDAAAAAAYAAAYAAYAAAYAAYTAAAYAAAYAAYAAAAAAYADDAAYAAAYAAYAAAYTAAYAARTASRAESARLVREIIAAQMIRDALAKRSTS